ncbi:SUN domain-containing protein 3-like, partial [Caloenas nicobarica]|uniref:SUN domain-containing protein 3-like n=1 Tax=Caloenas nicobarica TaxID=187106 RepID=UPI0032B70108
EHGVQEEKREEILDLTQRAMEKVLENYHQMPDWAMGSIGGTIDKQRTSKTYVGQGDKTWWLSPFDFFSANGPGTILQHHIAPGKCWAFRGSRGHVVIRLPVDIWPTAFTVWHISEAVSPHGEVSEAPKEFAVFGVDEAGAETPLGTFTYDVNKEIAQTFHVQKELPRTFRYIRFQVESNWGNPEYTCVYRVQVHGKRAGHDGDRQALQVLHSGGPGEVLLVFLGLDEDLLVQLLGATLHNRLVTLVHQFIDGAVQLCSREPRRVLGLEDSRAAGERERSPVAALAPLPPKDGLPCLVRPPPAALKETTFQVESNWGNPEYTYVYRVQVHGRGRDMTTTRRHHSSFRERHSSPRQGSPSEVLMDVTSRLCACMGFNSERDLPE